MMSKCKKDKKSIVIRFRGDDKGVAGVEFAFVFPLMLLIFFGMLELKHSLQMAAKVEYLSYVASDLVASKTTDGDANGQAAMTGRDVADLIMAAQAILWPFSTEYVHMEIDEIQIRQDGAYVAWSMTINSNVMRECGKLNAGDNYKLVDIPAGLLTKSYAQGLQGAPASGINIITTKVKFSDDDRTFRRIVTNALLPRKYSYAIERNTYGPIQFKAITSAGTYKGPDWDFVVAAQDCSSKLPPSPPSSP